MREPEYRAWEKNLKEMIPVHNIDFDKKMINLNVAWRRFDEIELMQYTGLKDKNQNKIYEADVLVFEYRLLNGNYITVKCPIIYSMGEFGVMIDEIQTTDYFSLSSLVGEVGQKFEVIGNIYDNPELSANKEWLF
jgi:uncharacterized phage protein (TIGR01671 family)